MFEKNVPDVSQGYGATAFAYVPYNRPNEAVCPSGETQCTAREWALVAFLNYKFSPMDKLSLRGEFYDDINGQRTGFATRYNERTLAGRLGSRRRSKSAPKSLGIIRLINPSSTTAPNMPSRSSRETFSGTSSRDHSFGAVCDLLPSRRKAAFPQTPLINQFINMSTLTRHI